MKSTHYKKGAPFEIGFEHRTRPMERSTLMDCKKYIGMDVHQATILVAVMDSGGKVVMDSVIEAKAATILDLIRGVRGTLRKAPARPGCTTC
jgi:hypothetical protein